MKVSTAAVRAVMALIAQAQGDKGTVTLTPGDGSLTLCALSSERSARTTVQAITDEDEFPECAVNAALLSAIVSGDGEVTEIKLKPGTSALAIKNGAANTTLATSVANDFAMLDPKTVQPGDRTAFVMPLGLFTQAIGRVQHAVADFKASPVQSTVQMIITAKGDLITVALDGYRIAFSQMGIPEWTGEPINILIPPTRAIDRLMTLAKPEDPARVMIANGKVLVAIKADGVATELVLNSIAGNYPDWTGMVKQQPTIIAEVDTKALRDMISHAMTVAAKPLSAQFAVKGTKLAIVVRNDQAGIAHHDAITVNEIKGLEEGATFNIVAGPRNMLDALSQQLDWTDSTKTRIGFTTPTKPIVMTAVGYTYANYVWPMAK